MCGLVGYVDPNNALTTKQKEKFVTSSLFVDSLRGRDSTGMLLGNIDKYNTYKTLEEGTSKEVQGWSRHVFAKNSDLFIGHNRHGTVGGNSKSTIHPFDTEKLVGAHNGTLSYGWRDLVDKTYPTDSESLYEHMTTNGFKKTIEKIPGAMALTWFNKYTRTLNFYRNDDRPLWFAKGPEGSFFWSSEVRFMNFACSSADIEITEVEELPTYTHMIYNMRNQKFSTNTDFTPAKKPINNWEGDWGNNWYGRGRTYGQGSTRSRKAKNYSTNSEKFTNIRLEDIILTSKKHGDEILITPDSSSRGSTSKKGSLFGQHAWTFDASLDTDVQFTACIPQIPIGLVDLLLYCEFLVSSKIQSVNKSDVVVLSPKNIRIINHVGPSVDDEFKKVLKSIKAKGFADYFSQDMFDYEVKEGSLEQNILFLPDPEKKEVVADSLKKGNMVCQECGEPIAPKESHMLKVYEPHKKVHVGKCCETYSKNNSLTERNWIKIKGKK